MPKASIFFLSTGSGGRLTAPQSGFHPQVDLGGVHTSCIVESLDGETLFSLGEEHKVSLKLMFPNQNQNPFKLAQVINLYEGDKRIGVGKITEL